MLLSAVSVLVVAQSSSEIPEGLMNNPVNHPLKNGMFSSLCIRHTEMLHVVLISSFIHVVV